MVSSEASGVLATARSTRVRTETQDDFGIHRLITQSASDGAKHREVRTEEAATRPRRGGGNNDDNDRDRGGRLHASAGAVKQKATSKGRPGLNPNTTTKVLHQGQPCGEKGRRKRAATPEGSSLAQWAIRPPDQTEKTIYGKEKGAHYGNPWKASRDGGGSDALSF
ncbi:hypothetical protein MRX96_035205 [Rhipicephalus microplus]